jgi:hypothetical protein
MYKKHLHANYFYPKNRDFTKKLLIKNNSDSVELKLRLQHMYIRRLKSTRAYILRIEKDKE